MGSDGVGRYKCCAGEEKFVELIERDILDEKLSVGWDDIASLDSAKRLLQEAVILPQLMPEIYVGIRQPWKGVLLFGPPGTGKTMLAKAVASQAQTTFFNVSAATLISKYHGESEKLVRTLFGMARHHAPATIFLDEVDAIMASRGGQSEHEASRRVKSEVLSQMDGVSRDVAAVDGEHKLVMVLATTNKPWDLDDALLRRLEKRLYIALPDLEARSSLFRLHLATVQQAPDVDVEALARASAGYSGSDILTVCREASMAPMRRLTGQFSPSQIVEMKHQGALDLQVKGPQGAWPIRSWRTIVLAVPCVRHSVCMQCT